MRSPPEVSEEQEPNDQLLGRTPAEFCSNAVAVALLECIGLLRRQRLVFVS